MLREKINAILGKLFPNDVLLSYRVTAQTLSDAVDILIREAVDAEREACAKIADCDEKFCRDKKLFAESFEAKAIALAIRSRGAK